MVPLREPCEPAGEAFSSPGLVAWVRGQTKPGVVYRGRVEVGVGGPFSRGFQKAWAPTCPHHPASLPGFGLGVQVPVALGPGGAVTTEAPRATSGKATGTRSRNVSGAVSQFPSCLRLIQSSWLGLRRKEQPDVSPWVPGKHTIPWAVSVSYPSPKPPTLWLCGQ